MHLKDQLEILEANVWTYVLCESLSVIAFIDCGSVIFYFAIIPILKSKYNIVGYYLPSMGFCDIDITGFGGTTEHVWVMCAIKHYSLYATSVWIIIALYILIAILLVLSAFAYPFLICCKNYQR